MKISFSKACKLCLSLVIAVFMWFSLSTALEARIIVIPHTEEDVPDGKPLAKIWEGQPYRTVFLSYVGEGEGREVVFWGLHDGDKLYIRMQWLDGTVDDAIRETGDFRDSAAVAFQLDPAEKAPIAMGSPGSMVNIWQWKADWEKNAGQATPVENLLAGGPGTITAVDHRLDDPVEGRGVWKDGRWTVLFSRSLDTLKDEWGLELRDGERLKLSLAVWDGSENERDAGKPISTWYSFKLEPDQTASTPAQAFIWAVGLLGIGLGSYGLILKGLENRRESGA